MRQAGRTGRGLAWRGTVPGGGRGAGTTSPLSSADLHPGMLQPLLCLLLCLLLLCVCVLLLLLQAELVPT